MELRECVKLRHSVRAYEDRPIDNKAAEDLKVMIQQCNREGNLHFQLIQDEPKACSSLLARYGKFSNVRNYIAVVGTKRPDLDEMAGYYGEKLVIRCIQHGLNTCWVGGTYKKVKEAIVVRADEKIVAVIAVGYGKTMGSARKSKTAGEVFDAKAAKVAGFEETPDWFKDGVEMALMAPTAFNRQRFSFALSGDRIKVKSGMGPMSKVDLGIVKYHFEIGASPKEFVWA